MTDPVKQKDLINAKYEELDDLIRASSGDPRRLSTARTQLEIAKMLAIAALFEKQQKPLTAMGPRL